jgi:hypothetical protein
MAGQLFSKAEADEMFGPVLESKQISTEQLKLLMNKTSNLIMFNIIDGKLSILGDNRNLLFSDEESSYSDSTVFTAYSVSVLNELLGKSTLDIVDIEKRKIILSVTYGESTMEVGGLCPPLCG